MNGYPRWLGWLMLLVSTSAAASEQQAEVAVTNGHIELPVALSFATNRRRIRHRFHAELAQLARVIRARADLGVIAIEGHADATGPAAWNLELSRRRAAEIVAFLVAHHVPAERLRVAPYGELRPVDPSPQGAPNERNRRVQFFTDQECGAPAAMEPDDRALLPTSPTSDHTGNG
jgi:outer membrane protein OmpA-like peptidoglycan-associated protein